MEKELTKKKHRSKNTKYKDRKKKGHTRVELSLHHSEITPLEYEMLKFGATQEFDRIAVKNYAASGIAKLCDAGQVVWSKFWEQMHFVVLCGQIKR